MRAPVRPFSDAGGPATEVAERWPDSEVSQDRYAIRGVIRHCGAMRCASAWSGSPRTGTGRPGTTCAAGTGSGPTTGTPIRRGWWPRWRSWRTRGRCGSRTSGGSRSAAGGRSTWDCGARRRSTTGTAAPGAATGWRRARTRRCIRGRRSARCCAGSSRRWRRAQAGGARRAAGPASDGAAGLRPARLRTAVRAVRGGGARTGAGGRGAGDRAAAARVGRRRTACSRPRLTPRGPGGRAAGREARASTAADGSAGPGGREAARTAASPRAGPRVTGRQAVRRPDDATRPGAGAVYAAVRGHRAVRRPSAPPVRTGAATPRPGFPPRRSCGGARPGAGTR